MSAGEGESYQSSVGAFQNDIIGSCAEICYCMSRHVSFAINHIFAKWGKAGHKLPEILTNTTVSTTKV